MQRHECIPSHAVLSKGESFDRVGCRCQHRPKYEGDKNCRLLTETAAASVAGPVAMSLCLCKI